jgi:O-methyltransferase
MTIVKLVRTVVRHFGIDVVRYVKPQPRLNPSLPDLPDDEARIVARVAPFTLTSPERIVAVLHAIKYLSHYRIPGDIVECGVWRGGSMMAAALALLALNDTSRQLVLYDTFEGLTPPTEFDVDINDQSARSLQSSLVGPGTHYAVNLDEVAENLYSTGYPKNRLKFVKGRVEDTIPATGSDQIALLRLDTDWYESTKHELNHLYPLVAGHGIVIIDDYGEWKGARRAVDEYFASRSEPIFLHRIDYTGRMIVRCTDLPGSL